MSTGRGHWIGKRGQTDADAAIARVLERQPLQGERVQQLADELIEDSPYQARQSFSTESVEELAQSMRESGFQGVLILRPHGHAAQRRRGMLQLVYGHRRRVAWRLVCQERGEPCVIPAVVREISDAQLLTIGAQENLQRKDLDPLEEAQLVAWHERMFFDKNQAALGAMLGKSPDWVSVRSRLHRLPESLKERLRQRPRAIVQILELGALYAQQPDVAIALAERVVSEELTVAVVRALVRAAAPASAPRDNCDTKHDRRANATSVHDITIEPGRRDREQPAGAVEAETEQASAQAAAHTRPGEPLLEELGLPAAARSPEHDADVTADLALLQSAAATLAGLAARAATLPDEPATHQALHQAQQALVLLCAACKHQPARLRTPREVAD
jgi:ParB/RepB/Spo0J family partition protein